MLMKANPDALVDIRQLVGLSQAEAARRTAITPGMLCKLEKGDMPGTIEVLRRLSTTYRVRLGTITIDDGQFRPSRKVNPRTKAAA